MAEVYGEAAFPKLAELARDTPLIAYTSSRSRDDFGGSHTTGCQLRRRGRSYDEPYQELTEAFGVYAGRHGDAWYVLVYGGLGFSLAGYAEYPTLDALKTAWELD